MMNQGSPHILVVDDHSEIRDLLKRFLEQHGMRVSCARDGKEMKRLLDEREFDLLVLDLMMPGEDGLTLCRELRVKSRLPIIMLTAMGEETDRIIGLEMGADDYLAKPFNPRELLARIKAVMRRTQAEIQPVPEALTRDQLLDLARGREAVAFDRAIDTLVSRLRRKLERDPKNPELIKTIWGGGYLFAADVTQE